VGALEPHREDVVYWVFHRGYSDYRGRVGGRDFDAGEREWAGKWEWELQWG
jgi:hypothetical protein